MLTKGIIIERVVNSNKYLVDIPFLRNSGIQSDPYEAILAGSPSLFEAYHKGDVVIVGFEDHRPEKPVIIGALYTGEQSQSGYENLDALTVGSSVNLPANTTIGKISYKNLVDLINKVDFINDNYEPGTKLYRHLLTFQYATPGQHHYPDGAFMWDTNVENPFSSFSDWVDDLLKYFNTGDVDADKLLLTDTFPTLFPARPSVQQNSQTSFSIFTRSHQLRFSTGDHGQPDVFQKITNDTSYLNFSADTTTPTYGSNTVDLVFMEDIVTPL